MIEINNCLNIGFQDSGNTNNNPTIPEFNIKDLLSNGEKGGLFIYNQNVFEDVEGYIPATSNVALICNSLGDLRRNLFSYSELALGSDSFQQKTASIKVNDGWVSLNGGDYAYMRQNLDLDKEYTLSCYIKCTDGSLPIINRANNTGDASLVFDGNSVDANVENVGNNIVRVSYTGKTTREIVSYGVVKYANQSDKEIQATKFQIEEGSLTDYQRVNNYGDWSGLAMFTTSEKSIIKENELTNNVLIFNKPLDLEECTIIRLFNEGLTVINKCNITQEIIINDDFYKLFIINRQLSDNEISKAIGVML